MENENNNEVNENGSDVNTSNSSSNKPSFLDAAKNVIGATNEGRYRSRKGGSLANEGTSSNDNKKHSGLLNKGLDVGAKFSPTLRAAKTARDIGDKASNALSNIRAKRAPQLPQSSNGGDQSNSNDTNSNTTKNSLLGSENEEVSQSSEEEGGISSLKSVLSPFGKKSKKSSSSPVDFLITGTIKKKAIIFVIGIAASFFAILLPFILIATMVGSFSSMFSANTVSGGDTGGMDYVSTSDDEIAYQERLEKVINKYGDEDTEDATEKLNRETAAEAITAGLSIIQQYDTEFSFADMTEKRMEELADLTIEAREDTDEESGDTSTTYVAYDEEKVKSNLKDYFKSYFESVNRAKDDAIYELMAKDTYEYINGYHELIKLNNSSSSCLYGGTVGSGDIINWRQCGAPWSDMSLNGGGSMCAIGCTVTSTSYLIAKSGTQLTVSDFNPGVFAQNASFTSGGALYWSSIQSFAPNFVLVEDRVFVNPSNAASVLSQAISEPCNGNQQPFIILYLSGGHWVAFDHVENGVVYVMDPAASGGVGLVPLEEAFKGNTLEYYKKFCANDVEFGSTGSSPSVSGGAGCAIGGNIVIPEEYGNGGYTITVYNDWDWVYNQGKVYNLWLESGAQWDDGIAVIDGRYLVAVTSTFGDIGDKVDFYLEDGTRIPCIIADSKSQTVEDWDSNPANQWGHNDGQNVLEFEVSHVAFYQTYAGSNPGTNGWHMEWADKRVSSATNLGENILS